MPSGETKPLFEVQNLHLEKMDLLSAQNTAIEIIENSSTKKSKISHLVHDIRKARSSREVQRIMWNTYLAGTGFGLLDSGWQKLHGGNNSAAITKKPS